MKLSEEHRDVKNIINQNLSKTVKQLQQECAMMTDGSPVVQAGSVTAQDFTAILEAAFIHGLKETYYEKRKRSSELPKPQFWDLILRISHKDALSQIKKMKLIRGRIGQCRVWLRLALNEVSLTSYLSSLLQTFEYRLLLNRYYHSYALFRDQEQSGIFLRYLQGSENLAFNLSCNSSILNSWTKTPLELAGVIAPSRPATGRLPHLKTNPSNSSKSNMKHASSWSHLNSAESRMITSSSRRGSLTNSLQLPLSTSPALSISSQLCGSLTSVHVFPASEVDGGNMVEVNPDAGEALPRHCDIDDSIESDNAVLHRRHLRKNTKRHKHLDGSRSNSSRSSSVSSATSSGGAPMNESDQKGGISMNSACSSITSSRSFTPPHEISNSEVVRSSGAVINSNLPPAQVFDDNITELSNDRLLRHFSSMKSNESALPKENADITFHNRAKQSVSSESHNRLTEGDGNDEKQPSSTFSYLNPPYAKGEDAASSKTERKVVEEANARNNELNGVIDIYSMELSSSHNSDLDTIEENCEVSPGLGNSLLCGVGWSSDQTSDTQDTNQTAAPVVAPPTSNLTDGIGSRKREKTLIRREGYLQKKGETLGFWRTRWFVLTDGALIYCKDPKADEPIGIIYLVRIQSIDDSNIEKNKSIRLKMLEGEEHIIAAESKDLMSAWTKDIRKLHDQAQNELVVFDVSQVLDDYEILEDYDIEKHGPLRFADLNTSWYATMRNYMTTIACEKGIDAQNYQCADCASPIGMIYGDPRVCNFTGQYYCSQCHRNEVHQIPARMVHNWDFKKYKVSKRSKTFLQEMWREPCLDIQRVNPIAYRHISEIQRLLPLRLKLTAMHPYISTCRMVPIEDFNMKLTGHYYMFGNPHLYSAHDLNKAQGNGLVEIISKAVAFGADHIKECSLCSVKGFLCEICKKNEVIYAFDVDKTSQCDDCNAVYHKDCLPDIGKCPRCKRRQLRNKKEEQELLKQDTENNYPS